jgi:hypothetical protein
MFSFVLLFKTEKGIVFGSFSDGIHLDSQSPSDIKCFLFNSSRKMSLFKKKDAKIPPIKNTNNICLIYGAD